MNGLGAWSYGSYQLGMKVPDDRVKAGIRAFKAELIFNGFTGKIDLELPEFGRATKEETIAFQKAHSLVADGVIGPTTARYLFAKRCHDFNTANGVPGGLTGRIGTLESANDPVAQGYTDVEDEGWAQINHTFHPDITLADRWTPAFAIPWAGQQLVDATNHCGGDWDGGVAAHNIGWTYARAWSTAGKPADGKLVDGIDWYARATRYVALVRASKP